MNATCWNCQGLGNNLAVRHLKDILGQYHPQVIFLSETKQKRAYMENFCEEIGFYDLCTVEPQGLGGGLALLWNEEVSVTVLSSTKHWIDAQVRWQDHIFFLTGIYGEPIANARDEVWEAIIRLGEDRDEAWVLMGDFNELLNNNEKRGGRIRAESSFFAFRNVLVKCDLIELQHEGNPFSWFGSRGGELVHCKLDRVLANSAWFNKFPNAIFEYLPRIGSDHSPIVAKFYIEQQRRKGFFRYDSRWMNNGEIEPIIQRSWNINGDNEELDIVARIRNYRGAMATWKRANHSNSKRNIEELKHQIDSMSKADTMDWKVFKELKCRLATEYQQEEKYWKDRSRENWLRAGDRNTKYFHAAVKQKRAYNRISQLQDTQTGVIYHSDGDLKRVARSFFTKLYTSELIVTSRVRNSAMFQQVTPKVTAQHNALLTATVLDSEIKRAAYDMAAEKCPGPDGLTGAFYHQRWHIVGQRICQMVRDFLESGNFDGRLNETNICLIPKVRKPSRLTEYRPISLCNFSYKIIAKVLSTRLKSILPDIISETQAAFVSGRLISDNILLAQEIIHSLKVLPNLSSSCIAIKTDMMKAFDRVEWQFLEDAMRTLGFNEQWINWIMTCVSTVSFGVLINGQVTERFQPSRGLRQGDPLSPFLFILCTEILIMRLNRQDTDQRFNGLQIVPEAPSVSHLFFADDSLFFSSIQDQQLRILKQILEDYREASGQKVNFDKSSIIFGKTITAEDKKQAQDDTGIYNEGGKGIYLGLPEAFAGSKAETLRFLEEKLKSKITSWKTRYLSHGGKEVLLKSVAYALPTYAMSCFLLPKSMIQRLNQEFSNFWWKNQQTGKGIHWISWERLKQSKQDGGMGFKDLEGSNLALLGKQFWRLALNPNTILARTFQARYHPGSSILQASIGSRPSFGWRSILASQDLMRNGLKKEIGNATTLDMWKEPWITDKTPRPPCPLPHISCCDWSISDFKDQDSDQWNVSRLQFVFSPNEVKRILQIRPGGEGSDIGYSWIHSDTGLYSVKSGYKVWNNLMLQSSNPVPEHKADYSAIFTNIWSLPISPKLRNFLWKCMHKALPVGSELRKKRIALHTTCPVCGADYEDIFHLFFQCAFARILWSLSPFEPILRDTSCSIQGKLYACMQLNLEMQEEYKELWIWIIWRIWKVRNALTFQGTQPDGEHAYNLALTDQAEWREHTKIVSSSGDNPTISPTHLTWIPPPDNVLKCNVDATWQDEHDRCGIAWILRDHTGSMKFWGTKTLPKLLSPLEAEASALAWAVMCMGNMGYANILFESDSSSLITALQNPTLWPRLHTFTSEILHRSTQGIRKYRFNKVERKHNQAADKLAKYAKDLPLYSGAIDISVPLWLSPFLDQTM